MTVVVSDLCIIRLFLLLLWTRPLRIQSLLHLLHLLKLLAQFLDALWIDCVLEGLGVQFL